MIFFNSKLIVFEIKLICYFISINLLFVQKCLTNFYGSFCNIIYEKRLGISKLLIIYFICTYIYNILLPV